jgi:hypothetical protein
MYRQANYVNESTYWVSLSAILTSFFQWKAFPDCCYLVPHAENEHIDFKWINQPDATVLQVYYLTLGDSSLLCSMYTSKE